MTRKRSDSVHEQTKIMADAIRGVTPPAHLNLRRRDVPFWDAIIDARAVWTEVDLAHAAALARCQADIETTQKEVDKEGAMIITHTGATKVNPKFSILDALCKRSIVLATKIQVHAAATIGESKLQRGKNKAKREALTAMAEVTDDDLIARPAH